MQHNWKPIIQQLQFARKILLTTHVNPDGDAIGSEMALYYCLQSMQKSVEILNSSALPEEYAFLDPGKVIRQYNPNRDSGRLREFDLAFILDVGGVTRIGSLGDDLAQAKIPCVCIDHHPENHIVCDFKIVDEKESATSCLIYELIKRINPGCINRRIAEAVYVGLMTDTGSFRFENATPKAFRLAAELLEYDVRPNEIYNRIYESHSPLRMALLGKVLQQIHYEVDGRLAWFTIRQRDLQETAVSSDEIGGFTDLIRSIDGVEVAVMFLEVGLQQVRVNLRSKGQVIVNEIARQFDGGGHYYAAGLTFEGTVEAAVGAVIPIIRRALEKRGDKN